MERVRLFDPETLAAMVTTAGIDITARFGDYAGGPLVPGARRCILMGARR